MTLVVIETGDGSHTLFDTAKNIYYRSLQGARSEADQVFVGASGIADRPSPWWVLELGLGTGLNFLATAEAALRHPAAPQLVYTAVEAAPLTPEILTSLPHERGLKHPWLKQLLNEALDAAQQHAVTTVSHGPISLILYAGRWQETVLPASLSVDAIYHDPFGPGNNPEAWTADCFAWSASHLDPAGLLVTYGAATQVRRAMVTAGLSIGALPGPGTKREMTVAAKDPAALAAARSFDGVAARLLPIQRYS
ncbi:MAG: tRNA (5-methylaminomethyl-2-thiouridine)(34)-methyltransferase MnmD [Candidatus Sericytochromatia bacterium]